MTATTAVTNEQQRAKPRKVQVDLSNMIGRIKPKPVCLDATLRQQSTSSIEISKLVFTPGVASFMQTANKVPLDGGSQEYSVVSSGSSTASRENSSSDVIITGTGDQGHSGGKQKVIATMSFADGDFLRRKEESERTNLKVKTQTISRNGRQTQRYYTDSATSILYRMTTGCIPILEDGKILFCSASRKPEWILPKGGWENDEVMEESAIRETFEEAGVFGIIGPVLSEIAYETRKGKKRRIEFEEVQRKVKEIRESQSSGLKAVVTPTSDNDGTPCRQISTSSKDTVVSSSSIDASCGPTDEDGSSGKSEPVTQTQHKTTPSQILDLDNVSIASETSLGQTHIKMSLFPLYVTEVMKEWPEQGRFRKVVDIDEAIRITETRPYFQAALKELKERNLHICQELGTNDSKSSTARTTKVTGTDNNGDI
mmetsp:Transcript_3926/g.9472  ORF Transcript_3926/g.9472 Transcript_3926/m.9472 type:complete len:427 (+) Transcript_3926:459-1739(+)